MSVEAILMYFETMLACEIRLIVQTFRVAVFFNIMCFRRCFLKSGTASGRLPQCSARAEGLSRGRVREGDFPPSRKGVLGDLPRENF